MRKDHIIAMGKVLPFVLLAAVAGCATPSHWEKPGVDTAVAERDNAECRQAAQQEASRYYYPPVPYFSGFGPHRHRSYFLWQTNFESNRFFAETRLAAFCMRSRGYELVSSQSPQTTAPAAPAPPTETPVEK